MSCEQSRRRTAVVNLPSLRKHTCNLSDLTAADRERREGWREVGDITCEGGERWQIGTKIKGDWVKESPLERWQTASLYRRRAGRHWSEGDTVPFPVPPGADISCHRKVILLFPLSQLTDCHSKISFLALSVSARLSPFYFNKYWQRQILFHLSTNN